MTVLIPRTQRLSRYLFDFSPRFALERNSLAALAGGAGTFARASIGTATGSNGLLRGCAHSEPRYHWVDLDGDAVLETVTLLLEDARTNVVLHKRDLSNAAWTKTNVTAARDQTGIDGVTTTASSILATAGNGTCLQAITLASSARYQSAYVKRLVGSGTVQMTTDNGSTWTAITVTAAWTRVTIPTQTLANPTVGFRLVTNADKIAVDWVQNENGTFASSAIGTLTDNTTTETRAAETLTFPVLVSPQALTLYLDVINLGTQQATLGWFEIGTFGTDPSLVGYANTSSNSAFINTNAAHASVISGGLAGPANGQHAEFRFLLSATGTAQTGLSLAGAAESLDSASAALALGSAWTAATIQLNKYTGVAAGFAAFRACRIAQGTQTLAYMREG